MFHVEHSPKMFHVEHISEAPVISLTNGCSGQRAGAPQQELHVHCLGSIVVFLLLSSPSARPGPLAAATGHFVLAARLSNVSALVSRTLDTPWLGPGLVVAVVLLLTLRGTRRAAYKPLHRRFRTPKLERYQGKIPRRHQDLEL